MLRVQGHHQEAEAEEDQEDHQEVVVEEVRWESQKASGEVAGEQQGRQMKAAAVQEEGSRGHPSPAAGELVAAKTEGCRSPEQGWTSKTPFQQQTAAWVAPWCQREWRRAEQHYRRRDDHHRQSRRRNPYLIPSPQSQHGVAMRAVPRGPEQHPASGDGRGSWRRQQEQLVPRGQAQQGPWRSSRETRLPKAGTSS